MTREEKLEKLKEEIAEMITCDKRTAIEKSRDAISLLNRLDELFTAPDLLSENARLRAALHRIIDVVFPVGPPGLSISTGREDDVLEIAREALEKSK